MNAKGWMLSAGLGAAAGAVAVLENGACSINYESVIGWGYLEDVAEPEEKRRALDLIMKQYRGEDFPYSTAVIPKTRVLRLRVQARTAKRRRMG